MAARLHGARARHHGGDLAGSGGTSGGATGDSPAAVDGANPGTFKPRADLDPDVSFDWEEKAQNGEYGLGLPIGLPLGTVEGTLMGKLDPKTLQLSGEWSLGAGGTVGTCIGPWTASFTP